MTQLSLLMFSFKRFHAFFRLGSVSHSFISAYRFYCFFWLLFGLIGRSRVFFLLIFTLTLRSYRGLQVARTTTAAVGRERRRETNEQLRKSTIKKRDTRKDTMRKTITSRCRSNCSKTSAWPTILHDSVKLVGSPLKPSVGNFTQHWLKRNKEKMLKNYPRLFNKTVNLFKAIVFFSLDKGHW